MKAAVGPIEIGVMSKVDGAEESWTYIISKKEDAIKSAVGSLG